MNRIRLGTNGDLDPRDMAIREVVVEILGLLDGVQEPNSPYTDTLSFIVLHNADQLLGVEDTDPVEDLLIGPLGTSWPMLSQQLGCFNVCRVNAHC